MKVNVNLEATDAEIRELAADAARRGLVYGLQAIGQYVGEATESVFGGISPQASAQIAGILQQLMAAQAARAQTGPVRNVPPEMRRPWPGGFGPPPGYGAPPPGSAGPRVVPMSGSGAEVKECFHIDETPRNEASWGCCRCASPNGLQRSECRTCGHKRCGAVVTPSPEHAPPPQVAGHTGVTYPPNGPPPFTPPPIPDQPA